MSIASGRSYAFGDFRLYPEEALLLRSGKPVPLTPKNFKLLCLLVENQGHPLDKDALLRAVWPDSFVEESNLTYNISLLRKALSDNGNGTEWIVTSPKRGYRFTGEVRQIALPDNKNSLTAHGNASTATALDSTNRVREAGIPKDFQEAGPAVSSITLSGQNSKWTRPVVGLVFAGCIAVLGTSIAVRQTRSANTGANTVEVSRNASLSRNAEANEYFQRGVRVLDRRSAASAVNGVAALEHAVALDPNFALAYAHLALAYGMQGDAHLANEAARRALALNESLPEGHAVLGFLATYYEWDWKTAERELHRSIELDPGYARAHQWLANVYEFERKFTEAQKEMEIALKLDPLSPIINSDFCELLASEQQFDAAIRQCKKTIATDPDFLTPRDPLEAAYLAEKKYDEAAATAIEAALKTGTHPDWPGELRAAFQTGGVRGLLQTELEHRINAKEELFFIARAQLRLGEKENALQTIIAGYKSRSFFLPWAACDPEFAALRSDPRFLDVLRRMGLS